MASKIRFRRDTEENWNLINPVLQQGEPGYNLTNQKLKIGDGNLSWDELQYLETSASSVDWEDVTNKPELFSGDYQDLTNQPTIPLDISDLTDDTSLLNGLPAGTRIVTPPATSQGASGDLLGDIAFDVNAVYFCKQNYTFIPPTIVTVVAVDGNTVWIDDNDRPNLDTDFLSINGTWRLRNGEIDYTVVSVTADIQYDGSYALELGTTPDPIFNVFSDYNLYQPTGVNIWVKSNWTSTNNW
jgi:hypothetical protein